MLDWEMVHLGDPLEDLAWAHRTRWGLEQVRPARRVPGALQRASGVAVDPDFLCWRMFAEVKHTVISLTAARSFTDGRTRNIRHADRATTVTTYLSRFMEWLP